MVGLRCLGLPSGRVPGRMGVQHMAPLHHTPLPFKMQHEEGPIPAMFILWVSSTGSEFCPDVWLKNVLGLPVRVPLLLFFF